MSAKAFVDTNVLIYAHDVDAAAKAGESARTLARSYAIWCIDTPSAEIYTAFQIEDSARIGFWDAPTVAAVLKAGADRILSEDLNAGQSISGVWIENPFASNS